MLKVRAHTCYLGKTGYAAHAREFFRELSKHIDLRIRNFTWDESLDYINEIDKSIIDIITLRNDKGISSDYPISHAFPKISWKKHTEFNQDIDIVLVDANHEYFYQEYTSKIKIAYTVWESTRIEDNFFNQLLKFDYLWVVSQWHKDMVIKQGYPSYRVFIINEGVDSIFFNSNISKEPQEYLDNRFKFLFFGRWDYRKSVPEIIKAFLNAFPIEDNTEVDLILSADNPYSVDGMNSTEERLDKYLLSDPRIKVKHFVSRDEYESYIKCGDVLITCARSEGWNIPLIEAMAAGTPVIYSNWGAQLEFTEGLGNPVKISKLLPANIGMNLGFSGNIPGEYAEPNFEDLSNVIRECYDYYDSKKEKAINEALIIRENFNWEKIGKSASLLLDILGGISKSVVMKDEAAIIMSHADTEHKITLLKHCIHALKNQGLTIIISTHIPVPEEIFNIVDFVIYDKSNPVIYDNEYAEFSNTVPVHYIRYPEFEITYPFDYNHGYAALKLIQNGLNIAVENKFKIAHFVNYDYIILDEAVLINHTNNINSGYDVFSYYWNSETELLNSGIFSINTESALAKAAIFSIQSKREYFKYTDKTILEEILFLAFKEFNATVNTISLEYIKKNNILNSIILPTYPVIKTKDGGELFIYLAEDDNKELYISAVTMDCNNPITIELEYNSNILKYEVTSYPILFLRIPNDIIDSGFDIYVPEYNIRTHYTNKTKRAKCTIKDMKYMKELEYKNIPNTITVNFLDGPFVEILGNINTKYKVEFIDISKNKLIYETEIGVNCWTRCDIKYYTEWHIKITDLSSNLVIEEFFNIKNKNVLIVLESKSLGDTIAWFAHIEEFSKKHNCKLYVSTFNNQLFKEEYPELIFVNPGEKVDNLYAMYKIGWFYINNSVNLNMNPRDFRRISMQETATDILGLPKSICKPRLVMKDSNSPVDKKYVCIAIHSTTQAKYWNNPTGWQEVTDYFLAKGMKVVMISLEENGYMDNFYPNGVIKKQGSNSIYNTMNYLKHAEMFIGVGSGLSWLSWAIGTPTVIISGFSLPYTEILDDSIIRIFKGGVCNGCFNRHRLDAGDWNWCPDKKGTVRQFECTRLITGNDVINEIKEYELSGKSQKTVDVIIQESYDLGMVQNYIEIKGAADFIKKLNIENFIEIGTDQGGTFAIWSKLAKDGVRISIDMPHGEFGRQDYSVTSRDAYLKSLGSNITMISGSSHEQEIKEKAIKLLNYILVDFLFIDGDHTYDGVKQDLIMYKDFVKPGGWIGFHDIKDTEFHRSANCRVDQLWNELEGNKIEFIDNTSNYGGIGFIQV